MKTEPLNLLGVWQSCLSATWGSLKIFVNNDLDIDVHQPTNIPMSQALESRFYRRTVREPRFTNADPPHAPSRSPLGWQPIQYSTAWMPRRCTRIGVR